jgi:hypothetical protein
MLPNTTKVYAGIAPGIKILDSKYKPLHLRR